MIFIDWTILVIVIVSALISLKRGFVKEALSLVSWVAAFMVARTFAGNLDALLSGIIASPNWRLAASFAILFIVTLIVGAMINHLVSEFVKMVGLTGTDRILGMVFGTLRGLVLVVALLALMRLFAFDYLWEGAFFAPYFNPLIDWTGQSVHKASEAIIQVGQ